MSARRRRRTPKRERAVDLDRYRNIVDDWGAFTEAASRPEPTVIRVRGGGAASDELLERLTARGFQARPFDGLPGFFQLDVEPFPVSLTLEHWLGLFYVQQASTGTAAPALAPAPDERVLDLCAAPGGKTTHMAELMRERGCLVACEISESRIRGLLGNVYKLGHTNVLVVAADGRELPEGALFDRVLVDAPCSGEGTLRRSGGRAPRQSASFGGYITRAQRDLLEKAVRVTRPGGTILYVTCTFAPEENEAVVSEALARLPVELEPLDLPVPHARGLTSFQDERYDERLEGAARIYPHHLDSGGLFLARLRRLDVDGAGDAPQAAVDGWSAVPAYFPDDEDALAAPDADPSPVARSLDDAHATGLAEVLERYGVGELPPRAGWTVRGGRLWMHTVGEWPLASWEPGRWRTISVGIRAVDFDSRGRPRPSNDFLRWADADRALPLDEETLRRILGREAVATEVERRGPIALALGGDVVGRGAVTRDGLKSEIPKARAADLLRALDAGGAGG